MIYYLFHIFSTDYLSSGISGVDNNESSGCYSLFISLFQSSIYLGHLKEGYSDNE